jgi:hypothetical protein
MHLHVRPELGVRWAALLSLPVVPQQRLPCLLEPYKVPTPTDTPQTTAPLNNRNNNLQALCPVFNSPT